MKVRDVIMGTGALVTFGAFLGVIAWKVITRPAMSVAVIARPPDNQSWLQSVRASLKLFFTWFNDYALLVILVGVLLMAAIDFFNTLRQSDKP
jgi:hypothetical protein